MHLRHLDKVIKKTDNIKTDSAWDSSTKKLENQIKQSFNSKPEGFTLLAISMGKKYLNHWTQSSYDPRLQW